MSSSRPGFGRRSVPRPMLAAVAVVAVAVIVGVAAAAFVFLYPMVSAWPLPNGWPLIYQGLLPTWDGSFSFASNNQPVASVQILSPGLVAVVALAVAVTWAAMRAVWSRRPADA